MSDFKITNKTEKPIKSESSNQVSADSENSSESVFLNNKSMPTYETARESTNVVLANPYEYQSFDYDTVPSSQDIDKVFKELKEKQKKIESYTVKDTKAATNTVSANITNARAMMENHKDGLLGKTVNFTKEILNCEAAKSNIENGIDNIEINNDKLIKLAEAGKITEFCKEYKKQRGVEFNPEKIKDFKNKAEKYQEVKVAQRQLDAIENSNLEHNLKEFKTFEGFAKEHPADDYRSRINSTKCNLLKNSVIETLTNYYGGDKEAAQKHIEFIAKVKGVNTNPKIEDNYPEPKTCMSHDPDSTIADNEKHRAYAVIAEHILTELKEPAIKKHKEVLGEKSFEKYKSEYENAYKEAFGEKNAKQLAEKYINSQEKGVSYIKTGATVLVSVATAGSGAAITAAAAAATSIALSTLEDASDDGQINEFDKAMIEGLIEAGVTFSGAKVGQGLTKLFPKLSNTKIDEFLIKLASEVPEEIIENKVSGLVFE